MTRTTEAWLAGDNSALVSTPASIYKHDPTTLPLIVRQSQIIGGPAGNAHNDLSEPLSGFSDNNPALEIHRPAPLKPHQKRRPSRGMWWTYGVDIEIFYCCV